MCDCEPADVFCLDERTARKERPCSECGHFIVKGQRYVSISMLYDGGWTRASLCTDCVQAHRDLAAADDESCFCIGGLAEDAHWFAADCSSLKDIPASVIAFGERSNASWLTKMRERAADSAE